MFVFHVLPQLWTVGEPVLAVGMITPCTSIFGEDALAADQELESQNSGVWEFAATKNKNIFDFTKCFLTMCYTVLTILANFDAAVIQSAASAASH